MNIQEQGDITEVIARLERIEKAILGDSEHGIWGYKRKLEHYIDKLAQLEMDMKSNFEQASKDLDDVYIEMSEDIKHNHTEITKRKGMESTIAVISTIVGGLIGAIFTLVLTGGI